MIGMKSDTIESETELLNAPCKWVFIMYSALAALSFLIGLLMLPAEGIKLVVPFMMFIFSAIFFFGTVYRELIHRPKSIIVRDDGVLMKFRIYKPRFLRWENILFIVDSGPPSQIIIGLDGDGALQPVNGHFYSMTYRAASEVKKAYYERTGGYPMTKDEYFKTKKK